MAEVDSPSMDFDPSLKKKKKKSVAFTDTDGMNGDGERSTAESHSLAPATPDAAVDEVTEMFTNMKKKKKVTKKAADAEAAAPEETAPAAADGETFDASTLLKKKKKKKVAAAVAGDAFDKQLEAAGVLSTEDETKKQDVDPEQALADLKEGKGIWAHDNSEAIPYNLLLMRFFHDLREQHPDLAGDGKARGYKIPPPQVMREGNKKTIFANLPDICKRVKRLPDHVIQFLFAELGTSGSVDGSGRLVIKGRFQQKQLENVLKRYIMEYVTCRTCKSADTVLGKENRLYFVTCNSCGSRRSVSAIKTGFQATVGKRRRMKV